MRTFEQWREAQREETVEECIGSAKAALKGANIDFEEVGGKLKVAEGDFKKAADAVKEKADDEADVKFLIK